MADQKTQIVTQEEWDLERLYQLQRRKKAHRNAVSLLREVKRKRIAIFASYAIRKSPSVSE